jgi:UDP-N-acetylmuramoylalanine--D-glutamate ligase
MIPIARYRNRVVAVFGLGRSGRSAALALTAGGARVRAWDDDLASREAAVKLGISLVELKGKGWGDVAALVLAPGVPLHFPTPHPVVIEARRLGLPIVGDVELLLGERLPGKIVGVTGTNGKSTTTALIGHVLATVGREVAMGGNLGTPVLDLDAMGPDGVYVIEMSSYQLDLTPSWRADVAVLLNVTPDHLDRHGGMEHYIAAKRHMFSNAPSGAVTVIGIDDAPGQSLFASLAREGRKPVGVALDRPPATGRISVRDGKLYADTVEIADLTKMPGLPGRHNWQNAAAAFGVCRALGVDTKAFVEALASFPGLAHRLERVGRLQGVDFINDSKATNAAAAAKALACFDRIYWIAGGRAKSDGLAGLEPFYSRIRHAFLIGEAAERFAGELQGHVPCTISGTLEEAVPAAFGHALAEGEKRPVVLLSPACASFDQFSDFEARGARFCELFRELAQGRRPRTNGAAA